MKEIFKAIFSINLFFLDEHTVSRSKKKNLKNLCLSHRSLFRFYETFELIFSFILFSGILQYLKMLEKIEGHGYEMS